MLRFSTYAKQATDGLSWQWDDFLKSMPGGKYLGFCLGGYVQGKHPKGECPDSHAGLHVAVKIWATLVNRHTHTVVEQSYAISSEPQLKCTSETLLLTSLLLLQ